MRKAKRVAKALQAGQKRLGMSKKAARAQTKRVVRRLKKK